MRYVDWFAGIGGFRLALDAAGCRCVASCEIETFPNRVRSARWGDKEVNLGDITEVTPERIPDADLWCGGWPCQDLSVAGKRAGIKGRRSGLFWTLVRLLEQVRPRWVFLERVGNRNGGWGRVRY